MKRLILIGYTFAAVVGLSGCKVGPRYQRPAVVAPPVYRDAELVSTGVDNSTVSVGDLKWSEVFKDAQMKELIDEALVKNFDVRIAAQRVLEQQAQVGITRSQSLPTLSAGGSYSAIGIPTEALGSEYPSTFHGGGLIGDAAWNLDFWGLYRRQNEAERAKLLATEWGRRATLSSVVINVAASYIQLRTLDAKLEITRKTLDSRRESLRLVSRREQVGSATMSDVHQAEQLLYAAEAAQPGLEREIREQENSISLLLGRNPGPIPRDKKIILQPDPQEVPPGIPSQLLERRPDIQKAEAELIAANARIGVARAQFFPQISITGMGGTATNQLNKLFSSDASFWFGSASLSQPLFEGGKLRNNLRLAEETKQEMVLAYQQSIASAFRDVSNALITYQKAKENRIALEKETTAAGKSVRLAHIRYDNGGSSYLEVLTSETNLFSAELSLANAQQQEALSLVQLYGALGGGWK
jgi:multidrug efflux system outer membrane protein